MPFVKPVVVIDNGSYYIKAGFACDNHPVSIFRTVVGRPKYLNGTYGKEHYEVYVGEDAIARRDELDINHPVIKGEIVHWDNMERVWHHIFYRELKVAPEDRAVMLSCAPLMPIRDKVKCCDIFFESLNAPALCVKPQSVLALYGSGYATGLSVDFGQDMTEINPIYEGGLINYANMLTGLAGAEISEYIKQSLEKRGMKFGESETKEIISGIRKKCVYITDNNCCPRQFQDYQRKYKLPSGEEIDVSDEAYMAGELFFQPDIVLGKKTNLLSLQECIVNTVLKCDKEIHDELYGAIVPHGGMASLPGLNKRLAQEIEAITKMPVNVIDSTETYAVVWLGGATFAGITDARKVWVYKKEYEDQGERIVRNRFGK